MRFSEQNFDPDPFRQFDIWYKERTLKVSVYPDAFSLATSFSDGHVSVRIILLKEYDETGFVFFTNYNSKKGRQLVENKHAAMLFFWPESERQVRIEGYVEKLAGKDSDRYFKSRPRESQIGAWASDQSTVIRDRSFLEKKVGYYSQLYSSRQVERPPHWGGFRLVPLSFEFWQEGEFRLHDRILYSRNSNSWEKARLSP